MTERDFSSAPTRRRLRILLAVVAVAAGAACAPQNPSVGAVRPQDGIPGPPESMPGRMEDYIQQIDFGAGSDPGGIFDGTLKCGVPARCGGKTEVKLRIVPSNYSTTADWEKSLTNGNGYIVAKVKNEDDVTFDRFNLPAGDVAYLWVGLTQGPGRTAALYTVKAGNARRIHTFGARKFCRHSEPQKPAVHVYSPAKCTETAAAPVASSVQRASLEPFGAIGAFLTTALTNKLAPPPPADGLWISCSLGCCEVQYDGA